MFVNDYDQIYLVIKSNQNGIGHSVAMKIVENNY